MPVKATARAALVETISDPEVPPRPRRQAADELLREYPAETRTMEGMMGLFPRPVSVDTFEICCAARERARSRRREFHVIKTN